jgi:hypothetical protein
MAILVCEKKRSHVLTSFALAAGRLAWFHIWFHMVWGFGLPGA